jgi:hypothetical protein
MAGALLALVSAPPASADALHDHDNGPLTGYFGIPDSTEGSILLQPGERRWEMLLLASSHSANDERNGEEILLDGETTRLEFRYRRGIRPGLEIGIELPYLWHESGGMDPLVDAWHDVLGLSGGFRAGRADDQLEFAYVDADGSQVDFRRNAHGIGDLRLLAGWQLRSDERHTMALRFGLKLPTGDSDALLGSGGTDVSVGLAGDLREPFSLEGLSAYYRASLVHIGEPDVLADRYREWVGHAAFGLGQQFTENIELHLQAALRGPLYDAGVEPLGEPSATLTFGGTVRLSPRWRLGLGVSEDVKVKSAPDVSFQLTLDYRPE